MMQNTCPACGMPVEPIFHYCPQCGKSLDALFNGVSVGKQLSIYVVSLLLPPFGIVWAIRYSKYPNPQVKGVGMVALVLTIVSLLVSVYLTFLVINQVQSEYGKYNSLYNNTLTPSTIHSLGL